MSTTDCASPERERCSPSSRTVVSAARACMSVTSEKRPSATVSRSPRRSRRAAPGRHDLLAAAVEHPRAEQGVAVVDEGAAQQDRAGRVRRRVERQDAVVLDEHVRGLAGPEGDLAGLGGRRVRRARAGGIRTLEEPEAELQPQHAAHGVVDERELDVAGRRRAPRGGRGRRRSTCRGRRRPGWPAAAASRRSAATPGVDELADAVPVGDDHAVEAPLALEDSRG